MSELIQKSESKSNKQEEKLSICDIAKENTSDIIQKMESQIPSLFQNYSNLYAEYLHMFNDIFGACYMSEKNFFDRLNIDPEIMRQIQEYSRTKKNNYIESIDFTAKSFDEYVKARVSAIKLFDNYVHVMMDSYVKMFSQFSKSAKLSD